MARLPFPIREQLIEARRNQILDAAATVFAEKGFHPATTKEIAKAAGVSEGTIYNYFANKADLLIGMITRLAELEHLDEELVQALQGDARSFLIAIFRDRMTRIQQNHEMIRAVLPEILINSELQERFYQQFVLPIARLLEQYVQARVDRRDIRPVNVPLTVRAIQSMFVGTLVLRIFGDETLLAGWDAMPDVLATLIFDGLSIKNGE
jgi:TetR/AcrR family fatty acid metabolism transcriptional regulator